MLKEHDSFFRRLLIFADSALILISFVIGYYASFFISIMYGQEAVQVLHKIPLKVFFIYAPIIVTLWISTLYTFGAYRAFRWKDVSSSLFEICKAGFLSTILFAALSYLFGFGILSRIFISYVFMISGVLLGVSRLVQVWILRYYRRKGYNYRYVLVVGTGNRAKTFLELIQGHS